jgi:hypothetical protein
VTRLRKYGVVSAYSCWEALHIGGSDRTGGVTFRSKMLCCRSKFSHSSLKSAKMYLTISSRSSRGRSSKRDCVSIMIIVLTEVGCNYVWSLR